MSKVSAEAGSANHSSLWERSIGETTFQKVDQKLESVPVPTYARKIAAGTLALASYLAPTFVRRYEEQNRQLWIYKFPHSWASDVSNILLTVLATESIIVGTAFTGLLNESNGVILGPYLTLTSLMGTKVVSNMITHRRLDKIGQKSLASAT